MNKEEGSIPGIEFEGPLGMHWLLDEVPLESIVIGIRELLVEAHRRGYSDRAIIQLVSTKNYEGNTG
ncbi:MAG: hypothetical protein V1850_00340 [Candidatus Bathyarchaeota archaeon]